VSVVIPFLGDRDEAAGALSRLEAIERRPDDEILFVDNSPAGVASGLESAPGVRVVTATVKRSAYAARNEGVELAGSDWILFVDADCRPRPTILDDYFDQPIDPSCGALAGEIVGAPEQLSLAATWARSRSHLSSARNRDFPRLPMAPTANLLVRRQVLLDLGGFPEGMSAAGGDVYFSWRLQEAGWKLCFRPAAMVEHRHRETIGRLIRQTARDAAGRAWLNRLYPGTLPPPSLVAGLARAAAGAIAFALTARFRRSQMKLIDGLIVIAEAIGYRQSHGSGAVPRPVAEIVVVTEFPSRDDERVAALVAAQAAKPIRIEAVARSSSPDWKSARPLEVRFWEDDGSLRRLVDTAWLLARRPLRVIAAHRRAATVAGPRVPLRRLAPAARRAAGASRATLVAEGGPLADQLCERLADLHDPIRGSASGSESRRAVRR
jgi:GT2 family glycosyltransferase